MEIDKTISAFLEDICVAFPEMRPLMNQHEDYMLTSKMEEFSNATTRAFEEGNREKGLAYLIFMSKRLEKAIPKKSEYINVYYVEGLFCGASRRAISDGWPLVPENLEKRFLEFHGMPPYYFAKIDGRS